MITVDVASRLLDFGARIGGGPRADEQLQGAVALHNILERHHVAYLADEVGMGKTYVALGAMALFRHFDPGFRVLVLAPRENIQRKWMKELSNFAAHNVRFADLRVSGIDGHPARPHVACHGLLELVREATIDPDRDFFARMTSFSLGFGKDALEPARDALRKTLPWLPADAFDLRNKETFKDNFARAVCCALPVFDLVIVDEAHNLKHGRGQGVAARNRVLELAFGASRDVSSAKPFPGYGPRARRVLFLSATPLEESYRHVWNQLDVFGLADSFPELAKSELTDDARKAAAAKFLVRRVTAIGSGERLRTKNQYRREWRTGGVETHDEPVSVTGDRQRLVVALVQKKVSELIGSERFNSSFQIGMLASFESFLETARVKRDDGADLTFDDGEQTDDVAEREGIDVKDVNRLARHYRSTFHADMPHPKMDAVVSSLTTAWRTGRKALVFVRRVASVTDLKRRLDGAYDEWLIGSLRARLPEDVRPRLDRVVVQYRDERSEVEQARTAARERRANEPVADGSLDDRGGTDTFFAWYFRGKGPDDVVSGANVQRRFNQRGTTYGTFFEDNHVAAMLGVGPEDALSALAGALGLEVDAARDHVNRGAVQYLSRAARHASADRMEAAQASALDLLRNSQSPLAEMAGMLWRERYENAVKLQHAKDMPDVADWLEQPTFFTELRRSDRAELRAALWPEPTTQKADDRGRFRERELRGQLLATAARLGHAFIDLYVLTIAAIGSLDHRERDEADPGDRGRRRIHAYLDLLEEQRRTPRSAREWGAFDELAELAAYFELVLDVNAPDARNMPLAAAARAFGSLLREQQPNGGMSGQVNRTLVQQFRMPGYPMVLVTTDLLQEGEDLHTFCSDVHHYGISWTPSAMEQRIGRIDRVRSLTDRRLGGLERDPEGAELLQVFYPHLQDTVEVLQVQRVLDRMNTFLRLMHEGLAAPAGADRKIDVGRELVAGRRKVEAIAETLRSSFPVPAWALKGDVDQLAVEPSVPVRAKERFRALQDLQPDGMAIDWVPDAVGTLLLGTGHLGDRVQPFALHLRSDGSRLILRCISPVGRVDPQQATDAIVDSTTKRPVRIGAILTKDERSYDLTVENDVLLGESEHDAARAAALLTRTLHQADELERIHLPETDRKLDEFASDLAKDMGHGSA